MVRMGITEERDESIRESATGRESNSRESEATSLRSQFVLGQSGRAGKCHPETAPMVSSKRDDRSRPTREKPELEQTPRPSLQFSASRSASRLFHQLEGG